MSRSTYLKTILAISGLVLLASSTQPGFAGPKQDAQLLSYVGNWRGSGELVGGEEPEKFTCRNIIANGGEGKINYTGRCAVAGLNLNISGTVKYNDDANRYEGSMNSTTKFEGVAIGRQRGSNIVFDFKQQNQHEGHDLTIGAKLTLKPSDTYTVDFDVWVKDSDVKMTTSVPFERK